MTIMASCGVSVVAFKQSGIAERRDATADDVVDDDQNYGLLHHADEPIVEGPALSIWPAQCQAE